MRGRYDILSREVAQKFEERVLQEFQSSYWERVFRFKQYQLDDTQEIGLISILQPASSGWDGSRNAEDIFQAVTKRAAGYNSEILIIYSKGDFAKSFPFYEEEGRLKLVDESKETRLGLLCSAEDIPQHDNLIRVYSEIMPPKESCMFFSFTAFNNRFLGDKRDAVIYKEG